jgi:hypothetical protein
LDFWIFGLYSIRKNIMNLKERYKELRGKTEQSMGRLLVVQQAMNDRAAAGVDGVVVLTGGPVPSTRAKTDYGLLLLPGYLPRSTARPTDRPDNSYHTSTGSASSHGKGGPQA